MSVEIVKKRGRPKKSHVPETIFAADGPIVPAGRIRANRKSSASTETDTDILDLSSASLNDVVIKQPGLEKTTKRTSTAKKSAKKVGDAQSQAHEPTSTILKEANAFELAKRKTAAVREDQSSTDSPEELSGQDYSSVAQGTHKLLSHPVGNDQHTTLDTEKARERTESSTVTTTVEAAQSRGPASTRDELKQVEPQVLSAKFQAEPEATIPGSLPTDLDTASQQSPSGSVAARVDTDPPPIAPKSANPKGATPEKITVPPTLTMATPSKAASQPAPSSPSTQTARTLHPAWTGEARRIRLSLPAKTTPPSPPPVPPKLTELPYDALKKVPEYRSASRKVTSIMVAIPIALFTSYVLYDRYTNPNAQKRLHAPPASIDE